MMKKKLFSSDVQDGDLLTRLIGGFKSGVMRIGFHFLALFFAVVLSVIAKNSLSGAKESVLVMFSIYLSLLIIFPRNPQKLNSITAICSGGLWIFFFSPWWLAGFFWAAATRLILELLLSTTTIFTLSRGYTLLMLLTIFALFESVYGSVMLSVPFLLVFIFCIGVGYFTTRVREYIKNKPIKEAFVEGKVAPQMNTQVMLLGYSERFALLLKIKAKIPENLWCHVERICQQGELILQSMATDPRDVAAGDKFLNRYLVVVENVVHQNMALATLDKPTPKMVKLLEESSELLKHLANAFAEQQLKLLENNTTDLSVELSVLDKLLKMEGFK